MAQNNDMNEMGLRMECLRLACATAGTTELGADTIRKADVFMTFVKGPQSGSVKPKLVTQ